MTYQQAHRYERGLNRIAMGRLFEIAQALGVGVAFFFEGMDRSHAAAVETPQQRQMLELARNFINIPEHRQQEALCSLA